MLKRWTPPSIGLTNIMHDSIGFDKAYTLYSDSSSEKRFPSLQQPRPPLRDRSTKVTLTVLAHGDDLLSSLSNSLIKERPENCHTNVKLQAFAGACVQLNSAIANFRISAEHNYIKIVKYYFCLAWKPTLGPFLESSILFGSVSDATSPALSSK